jgi:hypothetical protein
MTDKIGRESKTLLDKGFFYGLSVVARLLEDENIKYALYGGTGLQAHFGRYFAGKDSLETVDGLENYFRPTSDFDIAVPLANGHLDVKCKDQDHVIEKAMSRLEETPMEICDSEIYTTSIFRNGSKRPIINIERITNDGKYDTKIWLTFIDDNNVLHQMLDERQRIKLVYDPLKAEFHVSPIEYIVAGKLSRLSLIRDVPDLIKTFETFKDIDLQKVLSIMKKRQEIEPHISAIIPIVRKGKKELLEYLYKHEMKNP